MDLIKITFKLTKKYRLVYDENDRVLLFGETSGITYTNQKCLEADTFEEIGNMASELGLKVSDFGTVGKGNTYKLLNLLNIKIDLKWLNKETLKMANLFKIKANRPEKVDVFKLGGEYNTNSQPEVISLLLNDVNEINCKIV